MTLPLPPWGSYLQLLPLPLLGLTLTSCPSASPASLGSAWGAQRPSSSQGAVLSSLALGLEGSLGTSLLHSCPPFLLVFLLPRPGL